MPMISPAYNCRAFAPIRWAASVAILASALLGVNARSAPKQYEPPRLEALQVCPKKKQACFVAAVYCGDDLSKYEIAFVPPTSHHADGGNVVSCVRQIERRASENIRFTAMAKRDFLRSLRLCGL